MRRKKYSAVSMARKAAQLLLALAMPAAGQAAGSTARTQARPGGDQLAGVFRQALQKLSGRAPVPVLLPSSLPLSVKERDIHGIDAQVKPDGYEITLFYRRGVGQAGFACWLQAKRGEKPVREDFDKTVRLAGGVRGFYRAKSCGGSCSPPEIDWVYKGVLYVLQFKVDAGGGKRDEAEMIALADSAISGGER